jgi:hypothetical protein
MSPPLSNVHNIEKKCRLLVHYLNRVSRKQTETEKGVSGDSDDEIQLNMCENMAQPITVRSETSLLIVEKSVSL